jgi:hypothetical protein
VSQWQGWLSPSVPYKLTDSHLLGKLSSALPVPQGWRCHKSCYIFRLTCWVQLFPHPQSNPFNIVNFQAMGLCWWAHWLYGFWYTQSLFLLCTNLCSYTSNSISESLFLMTALAA